MQIGKENLMARFIECLLCDRAECTHRTLVVRRELWKRGASLASFTVH